MPRRNVFMCEAVQKNEDHCSKFYHDFPSLCLLSVLVIILVFHFHVGSRFAGVLQVLSLISREYYYLSSVNMKI